MNSFKTFTCATILPITFLLMIVAFAPLSAQGPAGAVVAIDANQDGKFDGHGVAWKLDPADPGSYVVTTLHLVAGRGQMTILSEYGEGNAVLDRAYPDADLALLRVNGIDLPSIELDLSPTPPSSANYWAYDNLGRKFDNIPIKLRGKKQLNALHVQLKKPANLEKFMENLCKPQYPSLNSSVLKLKTPVQPGHSGSPIINSNGQLVGLIDGGLINVGIQNVFWSVPANLLENLWYQDYSGSELGLCTSEEKFLYSGVKTEIDESNRYAELVSLGYTHSILVSNVYPSLFEEDRAYIQRLLEEEFLFENGPEITLAELFQDTLDVYTDYTSGATLAFPRFRFAIQQFDLDELRPKFAELQQELQSQADNLYAKYQRMMQMHPDEEENNNREYNKRLAKIRERYIDLPPEGINLIYFDGAFWGDLKGIIAVGKGTSKQDSDVFKQWYEKFLTNETFHVYIMGDIRRHSETAEQLNFNIADWEDKTHFEFADFYDNSDESFYTSITQLTTYMPDMTTQGYSEMFDRLMEAEEGSAEEEAAGEAYERYILENKVIDNVLNTSITIDQFNFLAVSFRAGQLDRMERDIRKRYYLMEICNILSGFQLN